MKLGVSFFVLRVLYVLTVGYLALSTSAVAQDEAVAEVFVGVGHEQMGAGPIFITDNQEFAVSGKTNLASSVSDYRLWNYTNGKLIKSFNIEESFDEIAVTLDGRYLIGFDSNLDDDYDTDIHEITIF